MDKMIFFKLGDETIRMPKFVGAFLAIVAVLLFFSSGAKMFESWDNIKAINSCLSSIGGYSSAEPEKFLVCQSMAKNAFDFNIRPDQSVLSNKQIAIALLLPVAELFFWLVVLIFALGLYNSGKIVIPVKQSVREIKK